MRAKIAVLFVVALVLPTLVLAAPSNVALLTDLPADHPVRGELQTLFENTLKSLDAEKAGDLRGCDAAVVMFQKQVPPAVFQAVEALARGGGRVFMDMRDFAAWQGVEAVPVVVGEVGKKPMEKRLAAGLHVVKASPATAGFAPGQVMPRAGWPDGKLILLGADFSKPGVETLAVGPGGEPGLVRKKLGKGTVYAADVLSLRQPHCDHVDAYYKYTVLSGALGNPVRFGQYYPKKLKYPALVDEMRRTADAFDTIRFEEEGPASGGYKLYSLNLGRPGAPLYFLYAAAHGCEWEPGYGLLTFARRAAEGAFRDVIDPERVEIKIIPILNPWGYDHMRRQNANGVDLNRQGDLHWEKYVGRPRGDDGRWGPFDYDWKGTAPLSEPEARVFRSIVAKDNLHCLLDFHGNRAATSNKVAFLATVARPENAARFSRMQRIANDRLRGRHLLRQYREPAPSQYLLDRVQKSSASPYLMNTGARGRDGALIELTAIYPAGHGTVLQTDVVCELCRALFATAPE